MLDLRQQALWLPRLRQTLLAASVACAILFYVLAARPAQRRLGELEGQLRDRRAELAAGEAGLRDAAPIGRQVRELRAALQPSASGAAPDDTDWWGRELARLSREQQLRRLTVQPGIPARCGPVWQLPIVLNFEGDFLKAFSFLRDAERMPWLTRVGGLHVRVIDPNAGQVEVQLSMNAYWAQE